MQVGEMITKVGALLDDELDNDVLVGFFNSANTVLTQVVRVPTRVTLTYDAVHGGYLLPTNVVSGLTVVSPTIGATAVWDGYLHVTEGEADAGPIVLAYNRALATIPTSPTHIPELPPAFHDVYVYWAALQAMHPEEEPARYAQYERDYDRMMLAIRRYYASASVSPDRWGVER